MPASPRRSPGASGARWSPKARWCRPTEATQLALIQQIDPVYVNSTQAVADVARLRKARPRPARTGADLASVRIVLEDGSELPQRGRLMFADLSVDPTSAQVTLRTEVANPQAQLLPGMYVRTRLVQGQIAGAMLVPQQAVTRGPQGDTRARRRRRRQARDAHGQHRRRRRARTGSCSTA